MVSRGSGWIARGGHVQRRMWQKGIWVWGRLPSWTSAQEQLSAPQLETKLQAATWTFRKVLTLTFSATSPMLVHAWFTFMIVKYMHMTTESTDDDHLTMEDLISYSFQVAKGMEFLSSRKVKLKLSRYLWAHVAMKTIRDNCQTVLFVN